MITVANIEDANVVYKALDHSLFEGQIFALRESILRQSFMVSGAQQGEALRMDVSILAPRKRLSPTEGESP